MSKAVEQIEVELDEKIPRSVVSERDGGGGRRLSYLEGYYVIDRLNKVFGALNWDKEVLEVTNLGTPKPSYLVRIRLRIRTNNPEYSVVLKEGIGYGSDKGTNNPHELAIKEAVTDALKVAAKDLGMSMGLALYDKSQENVDDNEERREEPRAAVAGSLEPKASEGSNEKAVAKAAPAPNPAKVEEVIRGHVKILNAQKRMTHEQFKQKLSDQFKVGKLAELSAEQMLGLELELRELTK